jgi:hypothetical protein
MSGMVELYLHSKISLRGMVLNYLSTETILPLLLPFLQMWKEVALMYGTLLVSLWRD